jgi:hypothetical protein
VTTPVPPTTDRVSRYIAAHIVVTRYLKSPVPGNCWEWRQFVDHRGDPKQQRGYQVIFDAARGRSIGAHRYVYEVLAGPIPDGLTIDHLCLNKPCVNPAHLEPVTLAENMLRCMRLTKPDIVMVHASHNGRDYVVLRNAARMFAVYLVLREGSLLGSQRRIRSGWPKGLSEETQRLVK